MTKQKSFVSFTLHPDPNWHGTRMEPLLMVPTIWWISAETDILWPFLVSMLPSLANIHVVPQTLMEKTKKPLKCQVSNCCLETLFTPTIYFGYNTINKKNPFCCYQLLPFPSAEAKAEVLYLRRRVELKLLIIWNVSIFQALIASFSISALCFMVHLQIAK